MNNPKLELAMAKLLPEKLKLSRVHAARELFIWTDFSHDRAGHEVLETEWLYVMHLVWLTLDRKQRVAFSVHLREEVIKSGGHASSFNEDIIACCENATFNQRATAMCKVKGIEL